MIKIAFLFPGQGSHYVGMGKSLHDQHEIVRHTFEEANDTLNYNLMNIIFNGGLLELNKPEHMFPALLTTSVASARVYFQEIGVPPRFCLGHSVGEFAALTVSGALSFADALQVTHERGKLAQAIIDKNVGGMTIIEGVETAIVEQECLSMRQSGQEVYLACYNGVTQVAVCGEPTSLGSLENRIYELGGAATPLIGTAPFHTPLMEPVLEPLRNLLDKSRFKPFRYPVVSNLTGDIYIDISQIPSMLSAQIVRPVQWTKAMQLLKRFGITHVVELGPKNVLGKLFQEFYPDIQSYGFGLKEDRELLVDLITNHPGLHKQMPKFAGKCLAAVASTANRNPDGKLFLKIKPLIEQLKKLQSECETNSDRKLSFEQKAESLLLLKRILSEKWVDEAEQEDLVNEIIETTGSHHLFLEKEKKDAK